MISGLLHRLLPAVPPAALRAAVVGAGLVGALSLPGPAMAQGGQERVEERELEYRSARSAHEAAVDARAAAERRFDRALQEIRAAQEEGNEDRLKSAYAQAQDQALELQSLEERVRETAERLEEARESLVATLDARVESLMTELSTTRNQAEREDLGALIRDLSIRIREVEDGGDLVEESRLVAFPEVAWDPRDGLQELRWKAELLERRARQYAERIEEIDGQIQDLRRRQRRNRSLNDLLTGIQRFDDDQVPVVSSSEDPETQSGSMENGQEDDDTTDTATREMTLDERIESLQTLQSRIQEFRDEVLRRARQFRDRAQEISS